MGKKLSAIIRSPEETVVYDNRYEWAGAVRKIGVRDSL